jgi:hypothetical protein
LYKYNCNDAVLKPKKLKGNSMKPKARSIYIDDESYAHLRAIAKQKKTSISTMVRLIDPAPKFYPL